MKRKLSMIILTLTLALCSILGLTACGHEHSYTTSVTAPTCTDQGYTTYTCSCEDSYFGDYVDALDHDFKDYIYNNDAKCEQDGTETAICDNGCGEKHTRTKEGSALEHNYTNYVYNNDAKCEVNGTETAICNRDNCDETNTRTKNNSALNHNYGTPSYTWNGDKCTAIRICANDNAHKETETVSAEYVKDTNATCLVAEKGHYKATFSNSAFEIRETEENSVVNGEPLNHSFNTPSYVWNGNQCTATRVCLRDNTHVETETVTAVYVKDTDVTCDTPETGHYKAMFNNSAFAEQNTAKDSVVNGCALNHSYGTSTYTWNGNQCTAKRVCKNDITHVESETATGTYVKDTDATCTTPEKGHYVATFSINAFTTQITATNSVDKGEKLGHSFTDYNYNNNATCTENGTETAICDRDDCNETDTREKLNTKLGHNYGTPKYSWSGDKCTAIRTCGRDSSHKETEIVTAKYVKDTNATCTEPEKGHYVATFTNSAFTTQTTATNSIDKGSKKGHSFTDYNYNNNATCTGNGTETATCGRNNCNETDTREKANTALGHDWEKVGTPVVKCTLSGGTQNYKCSRCTATKAENVASVLSGAPDAHSSLAVGDVCQHCGKEVLAKNGNSLVMKIDENNYQVEHYSGKAVGFSKYKDYITSAYISESVTEIGNDAFYNYSKLTSVLIPNSVTKIGNYVFYGCTSLECLKIPDSVLSIGIGAFEGCTGLKTLVLSSGLTTINEGLLSGCSSLENLTIPFVGSSINTTEASRETLFGYIFGTNSFEGSVSIKQYYSSNNSSVSYYLPTTLASVTINGGDLLYGSFYNCSSLTSVVIGDGVTNIGNYAFYDCSSLTEVIIPDSVISIGYSAFYYCRGLVKVNYTGTIDQWVQIEFADSYSNPLYYAENLYINNELVTSAEIATAKEINDYAFYNCSSLTSVTIGNSVESIGGDAFIDCTSLTSVNYLGTIDQWVQIKFTYFSSNPLNYAKNLYINNELVTSAEIVTAKEINDYAFSNCSSLTSVVIGNSVTSIGNYAFYGCSSLTSVVIGDGVTNIGNYAFYDCSSLTSVVIGDGVTSMGDYAFYNCSSLTSVVIGDGVTSIGNHAFSNCSSLTSVAIGNSVTSMGDYAFNNCSSLTSVVIGDGVTNIGNYAFYDCSSLTEVIIPDSVISIGYSAFAYCNSLITITIGEGVTSIGSEAFGFCKSLQEINYKATNCSDFSHAYRIGPNSYRTRSAAIFANAGIDTEGVTVNISANVKRIPAYTFDGYGIDSYIPKVVKVVFQGNSQLTSIGDYAFSKCSSLTSIEIPNSVTNIGNYAFSNCSSLTEVIIPYSVTSIGSNAFYYCRGLIKVNYTGTIDQWVQIEFGDFYSNPLYYVKNLYINNVFVTEAKITTATQISNYAFYGCSSLTSIEIPNSVTSIGYSAFYGCSSLTSIEIPDSVTNIGGSAFNGCSNLESITLPFVGAKAGVTSMDTYQYPFGYIFGGSSYDGSYGADQSYYGSSTSSTTSTTYYIPSNLKSVSITGSNILYGAFSNCKIEDLSIVAGEVSFGRIFGDSLLIPDTLQKTNILGGTINSQYFAGCVKITNINIMSEKVVIKQNAFDDCENLVFNKYDNAYYLGNDENDFFALIKVESSSIDNCIINDNTKIIASGAFDGCASLQEIEIPNSVTSIGENAFSECTSLAKVNYTGTIDQWAQIKFDYSVDYPIHNAYRDFDFDCFSNPLYYAKNLYINNVLVTEIKLTSATKINAYAFCNCDSITSITIGEDITIGEYAFVYCSNLTSITIGDNVKIQDYVFVECTSLTSVGISKTVQELGRCIFARCDNLKEVKLPEGFKGKAFRLFSCSVKDVYEKEGTYVHPGVNQEVIATNVYKTTNRVRYRLYCVYTYNLPNDIEISYWE